jgi:uncharacterized protein YbgA (DUF1722 family)/uncharacterized protein YbbK (DUF523 family)
LENAWNEQNNAVVAANPTSKQLRIGVSACLLGQRVRYDGNHKHDDFVADVLGNHVSFVPVCPEMEIGLGVPRETLRLEKRGDDVHMIGNETGADHTRAMRSYAKRKVRQLRELGLRGYVFKKGSPSCGMERVRVYGGKDMPPVPGRGLYADELMRTLSLLPCEEEGRLRDARLRESFIERVFAYERLCSLFESRWSLADLIRFHAAEKLLLMAHAPAAQRELGRIVASGKSTRRAELKSRYEDRFMAALAKPAPVKRHVNVLQHALGYFKTSMDAADRHELLDLIEQYRASLVPLIVPITLLRHHVRRLEVAYLNGQTYLEPHPKELMLRNHV